MIELVALTLALATPVEPPAGPNRASPSRGGIPIAQVDGVVDTICSRPSRAGVRGRLAVPLGSAGAAGLENLLEGAAPSTLGMSVSKVEAEDPYRRPVLRQSDFILQSPLVSVAIFVRTSNRSDVARVTIERTCITDDLEDWRPYWTRLHLLLRRWGYRLRETRR